MRIKHIFCFLLFIPPFVYSEPVPVVGFQGIGLDPVRSAMDSIVADTKYQAVTFALMKRNTPMMALGYGWQDRELTQKIYPHTRMKNASLGKCITRVLIKHLEKTNRLSLKKKLFKYFKVKPYNGKIIDKRVLDITLQNLFDHKSGWGKGVQVRGDRKNALKHYKKDVITLEEQLSYLMGQKLEYDPGSQYAYSNFSYHILKHACAKASKKDYEDLVVSFARKCGIKNAQQAIKDESKRGDEEIWYKPEYGIYYGNVTFSALDFAKFFSQYWINGNPRGFGNLHYTYYGSLPGTQAVLRQSREITYVVLINQRGLIASGEIKKRLDEAIAKIDKWPRATAKVDAILER